jgi:hypothetical protein
MYIGLFKYSLCSNLLCILVVFSNVVLKVSHRTEVRYNYFCKKHSMQLFSLRLVECDSKYKLKTKKVTSYF